MERTTKNIQLAFGTLRVSIDVDLIVVDAPLGKSSPVVNLHDTWQEEMTK